jgi:hypothetical protein
VLTCFRSNSSYGVVSAVEPSCEADTGGFTPITTCDCSSTQIGIEDRVCDVSIYTDPNGSAVYEADFVERDCGTNEHLSPFQQDRARRCSHVMIWDEYCNNVIAPEQST